MRLGKIHILFHFFFFFTWIIFFVCVAVMNDHKTIIIVGIITKSERFEFRVSYRNILISMNPFDAKMNVFTTLRTFR